MTIIIIACIVIVIAVGLRIVIRVVVAVIAITAIVALAVFVVAQGCGARPQGAEACGVRFPQCHIPSYLSSSLLLASP